MDRLNDMQREAALYTEGPLLILAGAGSGKTSTMTCRMSGGAYGGYTGAYDVAGGYFRYVDTDISFCMSQDTQGKCGAPRI